MNTSCLNVGKNAHLLPVCKKVCTPTSSLRGNVSSSCLIVVKCVCCRLVVGKCSLHLLLLFGEAETSVCLRGTVHNICVLCGRSVHHLRHCRVVWGIMYLSFLTVRKKCVHQLSHCGEVCPAAVSLWRIVYTSCLILGKSVHQLLRWWEVWMCVQ